MDFGVTPLALFQVSDFLSWSVPDPPVRDPKKENGQLQTEGFQQQLQIGGVQVVEIRIGGECGFARASAATHHGPQLAVQEAFESEQFAAAALKLVGRFVRQRAEAEHDNDLARSFDGLLDFAGEHAAAAQTNPLSVPVTRFNPPSLTPNVPLLLF
jgi:hypothetical protein